MRMRRSNLTLIEINMAADDEVYAIVNNIPKSYRSSDLRNFFSQFIETSGFSCFHFRHRPEVQESLTTKLDPNIEVDPNNAKATSTGLSTSELLEDESGKKKLSRCVTTCCVIRVFKDRIDELMQMYHKKHWMDKKGETLMTKCFINQISVSDEPSETGDKIYKTRAESKLLSAAGDKIYKTRAESKLIPANREKFTKCDLSNLIEMRPPVLMPNGNVGTPTKVFLGFIQTCRLPPSIITKLELEFPKTRGKRLYGSVPLDYGGVKQRGNESEDWQFTVTARGDIICDSFCNENAKKESDFDEEQHNKEFETTENEEDSDDDDAEEWDRHEALHNDVTQQERIKERLFEEKIELKWEKGGSGLVFYTDAQYWDAKDGDFDEKTADDWDIDTSIYYESGAGDKDARDLLRMRKEEFLRNGNEVDEDEAQNLGCFEKYTKGIGRKVLESQGWKDGQGLGKTVIGIPEPVSEVGQHPRDKTGFGYRGEKLVHSAKRKRRRRRSYSDNEDRIFISTIYDDPLQSDPPESLLRSSLLTRLKYKKEFLKEFQKEG